MDTQLLISIAIIGAILLLALLLLLVRRTVVASIASFHWQRKVVLEHYIWVEESSYDGYPDGSRNQDSTTETYFVNEVVRYDTHTTTDASGNSSTTTTPVFEMVPRRRTKYMYEIQEWCQSRELLAEGDRTNLHWPAYTLDAHTQERVQDTTEKYLVFFQTTKGKQYQHELPLSEWKALDEHSAYQLRLTLYGQVTRFIPLPMQAAVMP